MTSVFGPGLRGEGIVDADREGLLSGRPFLLSEALSVEGALVLARACELGLEGIVSKRAGSRYSSGNSRQC
jgi:ATP-dependent DNA ligase